MTDQQLFVLRWALGSMLVLTVYRALVRLLSPNYEKAP